MSKKKDQPTQEVVDEPKKEKKVKVRKIIEWSLTGVFIALLGVVLGMRIYTSKTNKSVFGELHPVVLTDSMEDTYMVGDVLIVKEVKPEEIEVDDDVTFYWDFSGKGVFYPTTHRISEVEYFENADENNGYHYNFTAHGINKKSAQCGGGDCTYQKQRFHEDAIIGRVSGVSKGRTFLHKVTSSPWFFIVLILIPCVYIMTSIVFDMFKKLNEQEKLEEIEAIEAQKKASQGGKNPLDGLTPSEIEALKKEMMEEMLNKGKKK